MDNKEEIKETEKLDDDVIEIELTNLKIVIKPTSDFSVGDTLIFPLPW